MAAFGTFVSLFLFAYAYGSEILDPASQTVGQPLGSEVTLTCTVSDLGKHSVMWMKGSKHHLLAIGGNAFLAGPNIEASADTSGTKSYFRLKIKKLSAADVDDYYCVLETDAKQDWEAKQKVLFKVIIKSGINKAATKSIIMIFPRVSTPRSVKAMIGSKAELKCTVTNFKGRSVMWLKRPKNDRVSSEMLSVGDRIYYQGSNGKYKVKITNTDEKTQVVTITINDVTGSDFRTYACVVQVLGKAFGDYPTSEVVFSQGVPEGTTAKPTVEPTTPPTQEPTLKPVEPSSKPIEPSTEPIEPSTKPIEPSTKPIEPSTKPIEPTEPPVKPEKCYWRAFEDSRLPSVTAPNYQKFLGMGSMLLCMQRCHQTPGCKSVSYNAKEWACYVMKLSSEGDMSKIGYLKSYLYAEYVC